jgi:hypothetical protein
LEISIASVVLPVPTSPVNHMPRPASSCSATSRRTAHLAHDVRVRALDRGRGSRSNETSRNARDPPATRRGRLRAIRAGRHGTGARAGSSS